jgi:hypothetical protein
MASSKAKIKGKGRGGFNKLSSKQVKHKDYVKTMNRLKKQYRNKLENISI